MSMLSVEGIRRSHLLVGLEDSLFDGIYPSAAKSRWFGESR